MSPSRRSAPCGLPKSFFTPIGKKQRYHELCTYFTVDASGTDLITRGDRF